MQERGENYGGEIARRTVVENLGAGAGFWVKIGRSVWQRTTYIHPLTGEMGIVHQILRGRPGTTWNKFYNVFMGINSKR